MHPDFMEGLLLLNLGRSDVLGITHLPKCLAMNLQDAMIRKRDEYADSKD